MARYVDGFLLVLPKRKIKTYRRIASTAGRIWKKYGALDYVETVGDDLNTKMGVPFPRVARAKAGETVVFSWIVYKSRAHRDQVNRKVMKDPKMAKVMADPKAMPFDMKRMAFGGFRVVVDL
jgi:uncharacterized protein YbaA (DUF1428 family)